MHERLLDYSLICWNSWPHSCHVASLPSQGTFVINNDTGVITVADPALLDRELYDAEHFITVEATDGDHM